jgi:hypothetical protein
MKILHTEKKGKMIDTLEYYYICKITKRGIQINEASTNENNPIYKLIDKHLKSNPSLDNIPLPPPYTAKLHPFLASTIPHCA